MFISITRGYSLKPKTALFRINDGTVLCIAAPNILINQNITTILDAKILGRNGDVLTCAIMMIAVNSRCPENLLIVLYFKDI